LFLSQLPSLQVPPEVDATEPKSTEEGAAAATPRKLTYAASRSLAIFQLITMTLFQISIADLCVICFVNRQCAPRTYFWLLAESKSSCS
jgi:hypothetical protein